MEETVVLCALNTKYVHVSPAPWCLAAGVKAYAPELYGRIRIIEAHINQPTAEVLEQIVAARPAVAGFSCYIWNIDATLDLCRELKRALPDVVIVLGGPEVSYCAKDVLQNNAEIDYILAGEGRVPVPKAVFAHNEHIPEKALLPVFATAPTAPYLKVAPVCWMERCLPLSQRVTPRRYGGA